VVNPLSVALRLAARSEVSSILRRGVISWSHPHEPPQK
jgi:hypothetical protein